jgi:ADP-ribose pyrophosphatase
MNDKLINKINYLYDSVKAKQIATKELYHGHFIDLVEEQYLLPNNKVITRERIIKNGHKEAVIIIAITTDNKYLLVAQNRVDNKVSLEFPSGYIEDGETFIEAAIRELVEETGYVTNSVHYLDFFYSEPGINSSMTHIVIANNCIKLHNQNLSPHEYINYMEFTFEELSDLINESIINGVGNKFAFYELQNLNIKKDKCKTKAL